MNIRAIGLAVVLILGFLAAPALEAQQAPRIYRLGLLLTGTSPDPNVEAFREGLRELGYVEGRTMTIDYRWAGGRSGRWPELAAAVVGGNIDVIVTQATPAAVAAKRATTTIPIVMAYAADPVGTGLVASLARPGGNVTGLTTLAPILSAKRLEILKEAFPRTSRVAVLRIGGPANAPVEQSFWTDVEELFWRETERAGQTLGLQLLPVRVARPGQYRDAFASFTRGRADALITLGDFILTGDQRIQIVDLAFRNKLPAIYQGRESIDVGGLTSYRTESPRDAQAGRDGRRQDPEGRETGRHAAGAGHEIRPGREPQDCKGPRARDPAVHPRARGRSGQLTDVRVVQPPSRAAALREVTRRGTSRSRAI